MHQNGPRFDIARIVLGVLFTGGLILASFWILQPFIAAGIWATTIVVSTWPLLLAVQKRLFRSRALAVTVMTFAMLIALIAPLTGVILAMVDHAGEIVDWVKGLRQFQVPLPPDWVVRVPVIGGKTDDA